MKKYTILLSFRFTDGADNIIGECDTIEEAKEICQKHIIEVFKDDEALQDLGTVDRENSNVKHVFAIPGVRFLIMLNKEN